MASEKSNNMYVLRVKLHWARGVWREIAILGHASLHDLHVAILDAFEWPEDDIYSFYMSNDIADMRSQYSPHAEEESRNSKHISLDEFSLDEGQTFLYVFADREHNQFPIRVMIVDDPEPYGTYPDVVDENGDSPSQDMAYT